MPKDRDCPDDEDKIVLRFFRVMPDAFENRSIGRLEYHSYIASDEGFREWVVARTIIDPFDIVARFRNPI